MRELEAEKAVLEKIKQYDKIVISRHIRPDGDAIGSTKGLCTSLRLSFPQKDIRVINDDGSEYLAFLGPEDQQVCDDFYKDALALVLDTATLDRASNNKLNLAKEIVKIDHHIELEPYGTASWVEDERSSVCEMIAEFLYTFKEELKCNTEIATYLFTGMVTDSGRFRFKETNSNTFRLAGWLLGFGIDTETLYAHLYLEDYNFYKFKACILENMNITPNGVAYTYVDKAMQEHFKLNREQASESVSFMDKIKGSLIWLAFIENPDATVRVRLRSRFVTVNELAEHYHGGGHACASGATVYSKEEMQSLIDEADALLASYKANNKGWL
jgi:bifunctional oligoribonuclease and PAP phosphatase NrnA